MQTGVIVGVVAAVVGFFFRDSGGDSVVAVNFFVHGVYAGFLYCLQVLLFSFFAPVE